jgi:hypothetical protein
MYNVCMRRIGFIALLIFLVGLIPLLGFRQTGQLTRPQLREMLVQLGYDVKDIDKEEGKEKFSVDFSSSDLNIPVGFEISPSGNYIWMTVNLGAAPTEPNLMCLNLLKQNGKIQPTFFYVTESGRLMVAQALENKDVTNATLRSRADTVAENVGKTKDVWQK